MPTLDQGSAQRNRISWYPTDLLIPEESGDCLWWPSEIRGEGDEREKSYVYINIIKSTRKGSSGEIKKKNRKKTVVFVMPHSVSICHSSKWASRSSLPEQAPCGLTDGGRTNFKTMRWNRKNYINSAGVCGCVWIYINILRAHQRLTSSVWMLCLISDVVLLRSILF